MSYEERALVFACGGDTLVGVAALPTSTRSAAGVLIVVGGPQYRAGSHRQFVLLSRQLARSGIPCMRFDYRGMGDSTGDKRSFEAIDDDIRAAINKFLEETPQTDRVILCALCDGASAACFYAPKDRRVAGLVLLNPWVRTEAGEAKTYLKHYYGARLLDVAFWRKLLAGGISIGGSLRRLLGSIRLVRSGARDSNLVAGDLPARMARALEAARVPMLLVLSGRDYVANEFDEVVKGDPLWSRIYAAANVERLEPADHTFSRAEWRDAVAEATTHWVLNTAPTMRSMPDEAAARRAR